MQINNYIYRDNYYKKIEPYIGNNLIKVLVGQRRVGKSFLLYQLMDEISKNKTHSNIIYINKEDYTFDAIKNYADLITYVDSQKTSKGKVALFIDEIQDIKDFEKALRHFQSGNYYDIYCTGSNASLLSGELATFLAGRYIQIKVYALSYPEFLKFHKLDDNNENLNKYIMFGGMPHLINLKDEGRIYYEYLRNVFDSIVLRDIITRYKIRNVSFLIDLIRFLADNTGSILSAKRISDYLKSQNINLLPKSILEYLYYLESVFFIERVKRTEIAGRKIFEIGDKFYFEDLGMRHLLIPYQQKDIQKVLENLVFHHLKTLDYTIYVGKLQDKEIDFVAQKYENKMYLQVAYIITDEKTHEREFGNLLKIPDNCPKMVISMDEMTGKNYKGIEHWNIRKFLTEFN
ncbi:MAG: ATP-binding protein [Bacteroidales bacterium]|nr:ATP-binding protein [Bacteroidales bacterium]